MTTEPGAPAASTGRWRCRGGALSGPTLRRGVDALALASHRHGGDAAAVAAGRILTVLGGMVGVRVLTESLSPALFGRYKLALAGLSLVTGILVRPFVQYVMRAYHDAGSAGAGADFLTRAGRWFGRGVGGLSLAAVAAGSLLDGAGGPLSLAELVGVGAVLTLQSLVAYDQSICITRGRQRAAETLAIGPAWLIPVAVAALVAVELSLWAVLLGHAGALALIVGGRRWRDRPTERGLAAAGVREGGIETARAWAYAWPLMVAGGLSWLLHESDRFILGYYHGGAAVGLYAAACGLAAAPFTAAAGAVAQVMYSPVFAASARRRGAFVLSGPMLAGTLLVGAGGLLVIWVWGDGLAHLVLAENYRDGVADLLVWIALGYACFGVAMSFDLAAYGAGRTTHLMAAAGAGAAANIGLDLWLVPAGGAAGAAVATAAALFVYLVCMAGLFGRAARGRTGAGAASTVTDDRPSSRRSATRATGH